MKISWLGGGLFALFAVVVGVMGSSLMAPTVMAASPEITVYKTPWCGCCEAWVTHLEQAGFLVTVEDEEDLSPIKQSMSVPLHLHSCHTAKVGNYAIEGHVPASDILKLLDEQPDALGLAVPGMPAGSPGMDMGSRKDAYDVILFGLTEGDHKEAVFSSHE